MANLQSIDMTRFFLFLALLSYGSGYLVRVHVIVEKPTFASLPQRLYSSDLDHGRAGENQTAAEVTTKAPKNSKRKQEYDFRRQRWLDRYGSLEALQKTFGTGAHGGPNHHCKGGGFFAGDLTPEQTRRLYHTLLPRTLLGLYEMGLMDPEELAPMAYEARMAAKHYARSRCVWYGRVATELFDRYRGVRDRGRWGTSKNQGSGMTWEEIYSKYEAQIVQEECEAVLQKYSDKDEQTQQRKAQKKMKSLKDDEDLTMSIYTRILEKSCATNQAFDKMFLQTSDAPEEEDDVFNRIAQQLDQDVRDILLGPKGADKEVKKRADQERKEIKAQRKEESTLEKQLHKEVKQREKEEKKRLKEEARMRRKLSKAQQPSLEVVSNERGTNEKDVEEHTNRAAKSEWQVLRVLAGTRRRFRSILSKSSSAG
jgi:hypothetical protein